MALRKASAIPEIEAETLRKSHVIRTKSGDSFILKIVLAQNGGGLGIFNLLHTELFLASEYSASFAAHLNMVLELQYPLVDVHLNE